MGTRATWSRARGLSPYTFAMATWVFEARDKSGKPVRGTREASDRQAALEALRGAR